MQVLRQTESRMALRNNTSSARKSWTKEQMKEDIVAAINRYRSFHKVNPLCRDRKIEREHSERWAKKVAQTGNFQHSDDEKFGENLYAGPLTNGSEPVDIWYWECNFDYNDPEKSLTSPGCGHLTQMVWKESTHIGVGIQPFDDDGTFVIVASFYPPGNVIGSVGKNVIRPRNRVTRTRRR